MSAERWISLAIIVPALVSSAVAFAMPAPPFLVWCSGIALGAGIGAAVFLPMIAAREESRAQKEGTQGGK